MQATGFFLLPIGESPYCHLPKGPGPQYVRSSVPNTSNDMVFWNQRPQILDTWTFWVKKIIPTYSESPVVATDSGQRVSWSGLGSLWSGLGFLAEALDGYGLRNRTPSQTRSRTD